MEHLYRSESKKSLSLGQNNKLTAQADDPMEGEVEGEDDDEATVADESEDGTADESEQAVVDADKVSMNNILYLCYLPCISNLTHYPTVLHFDALNIYTVETRCLEIGIIEFPDKSSSSQVPTLSRLYFI